MGHQPDTNNVTELSPAGATLGTFPVGVGPDAIAFDGTNMWVANGGNDNVTELSPAGATLGTFALGDNPYGLAFDGTNMWASVMGSNSVAKLSPTGATLGTFPAGNRSGQDGVRWRAHVGRRLLGHQRHRAVERRARCARARGCERRFVIPA